jgi:alkyl hydroperoxide reductase subunit AhpC
MRLLSDFHPKGEVARAYGLYSEDYGNSRRAVVVVGPEGEVQWSFEPPSPLEIPPAGLILDALAPAQA